MTPTKLLFGQILVVFAIALAGIWIATQWTDAALAYGREESLLQLAPAMLAAFLASDSGFAPARDRLATGHG